MKSEPKYKMSVRTAYNCNITDCLLQRSPLFCVEKSINFWYKNS